MRSACSGWTVKSRLQRADRIVIAVHHVVADSCTGVEMIGGL